MGLTLIIIFELRREINFVLDIISFIKLYLLIRKSRYDIVHTHSTKAGIFGRIAARLCGVKMIIHKPIDVTGYNDDNIQELMEKTKDVIMSGLNK